MYHLYEWHPIARRCIHCTCTTENWFLCTKSKCIWMLGSALYVNEHVHVHIVWGCFISFLLYNSFLSTVSIILSLVCYTHVFPMYNVRLSLFQVSCYILGDLSMEVLCYIWDQCFMGLDVPEYHCLPYFSTVWLILHRDRLLKVTSV